LGGHGDGDSLSWGSENTCGEGVLCVNSRRSTKFVKKLSRKMHNHGTIFLDSCHAATDDSARQEDGLNLAQWVANTVGKGIRVFGPKSSMANSDIHVSRYIAWHARIDVGHGVYVAPGARCPSWADKSVPDTEGDCECPSDRPICRTQDGSECPRSQGLRSSNYFLPMCAEDWAEVSCTCISV